MEPWPWQRGGFSGRRSGEGWLWPKEARGRSSRHTPKSRMQNAIAGDVCACSTRREVEEVLVGDHPILPSNLAGCTRGVERTRVSSALTGGTQCTAPMRGTTFACMQRPQLGSRQPMLPKHMEAHGSTWTHMEAHGSTWKHMEAHGSTWKHQPIASTVCLNQSIACIRWERRSRLGSTDCLPWLKGGTSKAYGYGVSSPTASPPSALSQRPLRPPIRHAAPGTFPVCPIPHLFEPHPAPLRAASRTSSTNHARPPTRPSWRLLVSTCCLSTAAAACSEHKPPSVAHAGQTVQRIRLVFLSPVEYSYS